MQKLYMEIAGRYGLNINNASAVRDAVLLSTSAGVRILRKTVLPPERILFVHGAKEYLVQQGFMGLDRYLCTLDGAPWICLEEGIHTVAELPEGSELNFENRQEVSAAAGLLAELHRKSRGFAVPAGSVPRDELGRVPRYFEKRLEDIRKLARNAQREMGRFDCIFLTHWKRFYDMGLAASRILADSSYRIQVETARREGMLCHHDYTHQNILVGRNVLSVVNFEGCCLEIKTYDLANFIRRKMRKCQWDIREAAAIVEAYDKVESLGNGDRTVMKAMLLFPQKFWRVVNRYYNSRRSWSERTFLLRLDEVIEETAWHGRFMEEFDKVLM